MKKKILIVAANMEIGGAERALLGLLEAIDTDIYDVDLFLLHHSGPFMRMIPSKIHLLPEISKYADITLPYLTVLKQGHFGVACGRLKGKVKANQFLKKNHCHGEDSVRSLYSFLYTKKYLPMISEQKYDLALGFSTPYYIVDEKVIADKKAVWIHTDYSKQLSDKDEELKSWSAYRYIVSISDSVTNSFVQKYPSLKDRIIRFDNILLASVVRKQADLLNVSEKISDDKSIKLLSVGRFVPAKNFDNVPAICSLLIDKGFNVKWYLIGYGGDEELIRNRIREYHMENRVIVLGKKDNPYPYMKACDLYIQPSRYEGKCVSVREAQMLCKPVVITNYPTSSSQLDDGIDGVIVPMDNEGCAEGISTVLKDQELLNKLQKNCSERDYSNEEEVKKIYKMVNG